MKIIRLGLVLLLPLVSAAGPVQDPEVLLRAGDAAAARGDFEAAVARFAQALERTTDPAPAAFNLAAAHLHLASSGPLAQRNHELREAELLFASFTGDDDHKNDLAKRRTLALYGLGVCRLLRAEGGDLDAARSAAGCLRACLNDPAIEPSLQADARHNLARARLLAWQLTPPPQPGDKPENPGDGNDQQPSTNPKTAGTKPAPGDNPNMKPGDPSTDPPEPGDPRETKAHNPHGSAGPPAIPDNTEPTPLTPDDAAIYLAKAARALRADREQQRRERAAAPARPGVRDW